MEKNLVFMLLLISLLGCKDPVVDPTTKVEGRVLEIGTVNPVPNAKVRLLEITYNGLLSNPSKRVIQSTLSDAKGAFTFDFEWINDKVHEIDAIPSDLEKYYILPVGTHIISKGKTNKVDLFFQPYAWVKYYIKNITPFDERDTLRCYAGMYTGKNVNTIAYHKMLKLRDKPDSIGWGVTKNNILTQYVKPITLVPRDTVSFEINY